MAGKDMGYILISTMEAGQMAFLKITRSAKYLNFTAMIKYGVIGGLIFLLEITLAFGQKKIDQAFVYPAGGGFRKYSIYEPSKLSSVSKIKMMVGFHPFGSGIWDGKTWRDTLINFAESKDLLLVCPDGGQNGLIDEAYDYEFIETLIDSMIEWYDIDEDQIYAIGYGEGAKAVYEYTLNHRKTFKGSIVIGNTENGTAFVDDVIHLSGCKNYYIIHGDQDAPGKRFYPIRDKLILNKAKVNTILMAAIGHTFNFPNRDNIFRSGFTFIDTATCDFTGIEQIEIGTLNLAPNPIFAGESVQIDIPEIVGKELRIIAIGTDGRKTELKSGFHSKVIELKTSELPAGVYIIEIQADQQRWTAKLLIQ